MHRPDSARDDLPAAEGTVTDASSLAPGQRLIYPGQGVCEIAGVEVKEIAGQRLELIRMTRLDDGAAVLVPRGKVPSIGLRHIPTAGQVEGVFHYLGASYEAPELDWKTRHRDNADRLLLGGILGVAEVVKGLHGLSRLRPLPTKERELYDHARHLLVSELAAALDVPPGIAEDYVDYAMGPPAGVKFDLKPPPPPVLPPAKPKVRRAVVAEDDLGDLGLPELDLEEGEPEEAAEGAEPAGEEAEESPPAAAAPPPRAEPRPAAVKKAAPKKAPPKAAAPKAPAKKAAPKKAPAPKAGAPKAGAKKAAPKKAPRGGKKK
jgi:RNA polymerase-interacting CarD/CdnL/TRCF family regulator